MYNECRKHEKEEVITTVGAEVRSRRAPYRVRSGGRGRPPAPPSDIVMFLVLKTLFCDSYRGTYSLLAADSTVVMLAGMTTVPHYNTAQKYCSRISENFLQTLLHSITVVLRKCRRLNIAGDGTGFGTKRYPCWFVSRKAGKKRKRQFVKLHLCISIWPAVVLSASVTKGTVADIRMLDTLLDGVDDAIVIGDVCLDPGYLSRYAVQSISDHGGLPVIKLKCNTTARAAAVSE